MNSGFMKRFIAYVIDIFIISLLFSIITAHYSNSKIDDYHKELDNIISDYVNEKISIGEYLERYESVTYYVEKASVVTNGIYLVLCIGYFIVFQYLNNGQTLGKKIMHIKIVGRNGRNVRLWEMMVRACMVNEILPDILSLILVFFGSKRIFFLGYSMISGIENLFLLISAMMVIYQRENRGLHDMMVDTYVIDESNC